MAKISVPQGYRRIIDRETRKIRIVSADLAPMTTVCQQRTGEIVGSTARIACEPAFLAWDLIKGLGKAVAGSNVGVGYSYGWAKTDRTIAIWKAKRNIAGSVENNPNDVEALRQACVESGNMDANTAKKASVDQLSECMAEVTIEDNWTDSDSFVLFSSAEVVKSQQQNVPMSPARAPGDLSPA